MGQLDWTVADGIGTLVINRPESRNAFTMSMIRDWEEILRSCRTDDGVRVVILTGAGDRAFCAGIDLSWLTEGHTPLERKTDLHAGIQRIALAVEDLDKPIIAAINGVAVGAGLDMALMCDMRVMSSTARVSEGYVKLGLAPGGGGAYFLPRLVGLAKALELLLTGEPVDAAEALRIGLVNQVVAPHELAETVLTLARSIAANPPASVRMIRRVTRQSASLELRPALDLVSSHVAVLATTDDVGEALSAMTERRDGKYVGR
ncbi:MULTISPECIES: enoyl-CoA hydratase-related protein [unclassified Mycolicibacterium]|uniref:enoyl-CoA hydratase/isomerase family protein n=1 Tax=unclassified Mycolicibacterium TaxID=2636767 RepID=UPI001F4C47B0|nr:enoyl-CoA hydratase-related protein [Mycolicibacterium sp. YH-1]UNB51201.1 enoyl-CoA hydratase-related protein [Mycolicibacterium sp. YH-1]